LKIAGREPKFTFGTPAAGPTGPPAPVPLPLEAPHVHAAASPLPPVAQLRLESERRLAMLVTSLMLLPNILFAVTDRALVSDPGTLWLLYALRASQLALWIASALLIRRAQSRRTLRTILFALALGVVAFVLLVSWLRPADNYMPVRTLIVISFGTFVALPHRFRNQLISWLVLLAGTVALLWLRYTGMSGVDRYSVMANFLLAGALGIVIARNRSALDHDLDEALERERAAIEARKRAAAALRTLEGIIPICSYCHHVRTEEGAWEGLDRYVHHRTDAQFSHGVCPQCAAEHFPGMLKGEVGAD